MRTTTKKATTNIAKKWPQTLWLTFRASLSITKVTFILKTGLYHYRQTSLSSATMDIGLVTFARAHPSTEQSDLMCLKSCQKRRVLYRSDGLKLYLFTPNLLENVSMPKTRLAAPKPWCNIHVLSLALFSVSRVRDLGNSSRASWHFHLKLIQNATIFYRAAWNATRS